jgi:hypothetical protein
VGRFLAKHPLEKQRRDKDNIMMDLQEMVLRIRGG